jgi:hypothetical protein
MHESAGELNNMSYSVFCWRRGDINSARRVSEVTMAVPRGHRITNEPQPHCALHTLASRLLSLLSLVCAPLAKSAKKQLSVSLCAPLVTQGH